MQIYERECSLYDQQPSFTAFPLDKSVATGRLMAFTEGDIVGTGAATVAHIGQNIRTTGYKIKLAPCVPECFAGRATNFVMIDLTVLPQTHSRPGCERHVRS